MVESKKALKARLQEAGLWDEYLAERAKLAADGLTPAQARDEALRRVEARASDRARLQAIGEPAKEMPRAEKPSEAPEELPDFSRNVPNPDAVEWVANNLANARIKAGDAPGPQAWSLLSWVRRSPVNESTFWGSIWPRVAGMAKGPQDEKNGTDIGTEKALELAEQCLREILANEKVKCPQCGCEFLEQV